MKEIIAKLLVIRVTIWISFPLTIIIGIKVTNIEDRFWIFEFMET